MRRKDKEILDPARIEDIISNSLFCHVAMSDSSGPYCVPMCFAFHDGRIFLHSSAEGKKIEILRKNPHVCILVERECSLIRALSPCGFGMAYESVMIQGFAQFLSRTEKHKALEIIARRYAGVSGGPYSDDQLSDLAVIEVNIISCSGRWSGP